MLEQQKNKYNKVIEAVIAVVFGFGASQIIRLGGNLVLTRLLVPELFGIAAIARLFVNMTGLFSDIGTGPAIIRSERAHDSSFLNTAWTIDVIRGAVLSVICIGIAFPVSLFYDEGILFPVIIFLGVLNIPSALRSTSLVVLQKSLQQKRLTIIEIFTQTISLIVMISLAYIYRNIWALLIGELAGTLFRTLISHFINGKSPNRFFLEKKAVKEILGFGKWILLSTAIMALATQVDRMILGKLFPMAWLGIYGIAINFSNLPKQIINRLSDKVLYPFLTEYSKLSREEFRNKIRIPRAKLLPLLAIGVAVFACFSDYVIQILYDSRYSEAAWILPIISIGMWPLILNESIDSALLSIGKPQYATMANLVKFIYMIFFVPLGFVLGGSLGAVIAVALNDLLPYIVIVIGLRREEISLIRQDLLATLLFILIICFIIFVRIHIGLGIPGESEFLSLK